MALDVIVEYKGKHPYKNKDSEMKRIIGQRWIKTGGDKFYFCMPTDQSYELVNRIIMKKTPPQ